MNKGRFQLLMNVEGKRKGWFCVILPFKKILGKLWQERNFLLKEIQITLYITVGGVVLFLTVKIDLCLEPHWVSGQFGLHPVLN